MRHVLLEMLSIDKILDRFTMYQVLVTVLGGYIVATLTLSITGLLEFSPSSLLLSLVVVLCSVLFTHYMLVRMTGAPANVWSSIITGLILFLIFSPSATVSGLAVLAFISSLSIIGKYVVRYRQVHVFNPAALTAVVAAVIGIAYASWWVGTVYLTPLLVIGGLLVARKVRRVRMVLVGVAASVLMVGVFGLLQGNFSGAVFATLLLSSPLWFFMTIMVTEPLTTPAGSWAQTLYGGFVGLLSQMPFSVGPLFNSPEFALVIANALVWPLSLRGRLTLTCVQITAVARNIYEYTFRPSFPFTFVAGQYLEYALPHQSPDGRGTRRFFTIASSPTRRNIKLVIKMNPSGSTFKRALGNFGHKNVLYASQLSGDFVLPENVSEHKYVFVAGGIGITPFLSHLQFCADIKQRIDAHLLYCNNQVEDVAYAEKLAAYAPIGLSTTHVLNKPPEQWLGLSGYLTEAMIRATVPDVAERLVYLSGPPAMVGAYEALFQRCGVPKRNIKTDYFPGLA